MPTFFRAVFGLLALLFGYAAFLQLNDTDALIWVAVYGIATGLCLLAASNHEAPPTFPFFVGAAALGWAGYLASLIWGGASLTPMYPDQQLHPGNLISGTEEGREMGGLLIIAAAMALMIIVQLYERHYTTKRRLQGRR